MTTAELHQTQIEFIEFLVESSALRFGDFTTKSGRKTPYFINMGCFSSGPLISRLGDFYAQHIVAQSLDRGITTLFGPAYKGIPLCVTTAISLATRYSIVKQFSFDRKEAKFHGDKGTLVGHQLTEDDSVLIIEDVLTAGTTLKEVVPKLRNDFGVTVSGVVLAVDRMERGAGALSASQEVEESLQVKVSPLISLEQIRAWIQQAARFREQDKSAIVEAIDTYRASYGVGG